MVPVAEQHVEPQELPAWPVVQQVSQQVWLEVGQRGEPLAWQQDELWDVQSVLQQGEPLAWLGDEPQVLRLALQQVLREVLHRGEVLALRWGEVSVSQRVLRLDEGGASARPYWVWRQGG